MLELTNVTVEIDGKRLVDGNSFAVPAGAVTAIVGESGSGKSLTVAAILGMLPANGNVTGTIRFKEEELLSLSANEMADVRRTSLFTVFQDALNSFNPSVKMKRQMFELSGRRKGDPERTFQPKMQRILEELGLKQDVFEHYPFELSGGMLQRCLIACAFYVEPELLIADEPTSAVDALRQQEIISLLKKLNRERGTAVLLITHDLDVAAEADHLVVMKNGRAIEEGAVANVFRNPQHPYTKRLLDSRF